MKKQETNLKTKKVISIIEIVIGSLFIAAWVLAVLLQKLMPGSSVADWIKTNVWDIDSFVTGWNSLFPKIIHSVIYIILIYAISKVVRSIFKGLKKKKDSHSGSVITLLDGFVKYGSAIAIIILILYACGVDTNAIWASAGILTLVIGLGAQSLIADIIAGMFIIFENEYQVGEIISIDDFRGTVTEIGIRSTKLLDTAGNIKIINNSDISNIVNMSRELSLAVVDCEFPYDVPLEYIEKLFMDNLESFKNDIPAIVDGPFYKGVSGYGDSNVAVKLVAKCAEEDRYQVQRDMLRKYRMIFTEAGIDLSFQQVVVQNYKPTEIKVTKKDKIQAQQFTEEQRELSEELDSNNDVK